MKRIGIYVIIFIMVLLFRENIAFFYGNILGVFKLDNNYYDAVIDLKDDRIEYLEKEFRNYDEFSKNIKLINYDYKISKIIYKENYNTNIFKLQYGSKDNISNGMAVVNEYGMVGKITDVSNNICTLTTLRDLKDVSVIIDNNYGKLNYDYENNFFIVDDISNYDKVYVNDKVYTSSYGTIKERLYIGKVIKVENNTISKKVFVSSEVDFNNLNYVLIVGDFN